MRIVGDLIYLYYQISALSKLRKENLAGFILEFYKVVLGHQLQSSSKKIISAALISFAAMCAAPAMAADYNSGNGYNSGGNYNDGIVMPQEKAHFWSGNWSLTLGGSGYSGPSYEGDSKNEFKFAPIFSIGRTGSEARFSSRNDNPSFGLISAGPFNAGIVGKIIWQRDGSTSDDLKGMKRVKLGGEAGLFAELYPVDWMRARVEVRHGIRSHQGVVADIAVDAFHDVTPTVRLSAGPRMFVASKDYYEAFYGVDEIRAPLTGLKPYNPKGGVGSYGAGGAVTWKTTDTITTSLFGEYDRLTGPSADSSLVKQRGSKNQFTVGVSGSYRFDFTLD